MIFAVAQETSLTVPIWVAVVSAVVGPSLLLLATRFFSKGDQISVAQIELQKVAVNANVSVIQALQSQVQTLTERNTLLDLRRAEAEVDKNRAIATLQEAETKYRSLLGILEDRKKREDATPQPPTSPREGA